jgi:hypothetical protein
MKKNMQASHLTHFSANFTRPVFKTVLWALLFLILPFLSRSQTTTLDDFRTAAASGEGVTLIPFKDLRVEATSIADDVKRRKSDLESFNLGTFTDQKTNLLKMIQEAKGKIELLKKQKEEFASKNPGADVPKFYDEDIAKQERITEDADRSLRELNERIRLGADGFDRLYQSRAGLREYFDRVLRLLDEAKSNPSRHLGDNPSDEDKNKLNEYIRIIVGDIEDEKKNHRDEENKNKETSGKYMELLNKTSV